MSKHPRFRPTAIATSQQRGAVLLFSLIALVIMLLAAVALVRSFQSSLFTAGNIAFKRDLQNQSERAVEVALNAFRSGGPLASPTVRASSATANNYSAVMLPVNAQGIPNALQNDTTFAAVGLASNDIAVADQAVTVRYVIDRLCASVGDENSLGPASCTLADNPTPAGGSSSNLLGADKAALCPTCASAAPQGVVYRLSVKVTGPRRTQSFFQSTFTVPSSL